MVSLQNFLFFLPLVLYLAMSCLLLSLVRNSEAIEATDLQLINSFLTDSEGRVALIMPRGDWSMLLLIWMDGSDPSLRSAVKSYSITVAEGQRVSI